MASTRGLVSGFAQGYGLVSDVQDRKKRRALQQQRYDQQDQRYADEAARQRDLMSMKKSGIAYEKERDKVEDARYNKEFAADQDYRKSRLAQSRQRLGISAANARNSAYRNQLAAQEQEIALAQARRKQKEAQNRRYLEAAGMELEANGATPKFVEMMKQGGQNPERMLDPEFDKSLDTITATLDGAPIRKGKQVEAANTFFRDRINKVVGTEDSQGRPIVRAELADFYPSQDGKYATLELNTWVENTDGSVSKQKAPVTQNRSAKDEYVLEVPMDKALGYIKGQQILNAATNKKQLQSSLEQAMVLNGGSPDGSPVDGEYKKLNSNQIFNPATGETKNIKPIEDPGERQETAFKMAREDWQNQNKDYAGNIKNVPAPQKFKEIDALTREYEKRLTPGGPDESVVIADHPKYGDITEDDIETTMQQTGKTRAEVLKELRFDG